MPATLQLDVPRQLVHVTFSGDVTDDEVLGLQRALHQTPEAEPWWQALVDFSAADRMHLTAGAIRELGARSRFTAESRIAIVAPRDALYGVARMVELMHPGPCGIMVFRDRESAVAWLDDERRTTS